MPSEVEPRPAGGASEADVRTALFELEQLGLVRVLEDERVRVLEEERG